MKMKKSSQKMIKEEEEEEVRKEEDVANVSFTFVHFTFFFFDCKYMRKQPAHTRRFGVTSFLCIKWECVFSL